MGWSERGRNWATASRKSVATHQTETKAGVKEGRGVKEVTYFFYMSSYNLTVYAVNYDGVQF